MLVSLSLLVFPVQLPLSTVSDPTRAPPFVEVAHAASPSYQEWTLGNGNVKLPIPLRMGDWTLQDPVLLGTGGGGAVFSMTSSSTGTSRVALKVSWESSASSVRNECQILQSLEQHQVSGVEQCLASAPYPENRSHQRIMIVMTPVFEDRTLVNSIRDIPSSDLQQKATQQVIRTLLEMLAARVATTDVQPLISADTGRVLLIDMTEAQQFPKTPSFLDLALCGSFVSEMMALIPESMHEFSAMVFDEALKEVIGGNAQSAGQDVPSQSVCDALHPSVREILKDQVSFLSQSSADLLGGS